MADIVTADVRSRMMSGIKGKDTKPELLVRKALHRSGFRYRLHVKGLPGKPDLVFPKWKAVIFVNGCFWHGHDCHLFRLPASRADFWREKIAGNVERDDRVVESLKTAGWRVAIVWGCALEGKERLDSEEVLSLLAEWLQGNAGTLEIRGVAA
ncbi:DNA mismatch endonuclease Vsr [Cohaesibacter sp. CAU 1516]|uniref:very short patch repair endonuclease n=1 Tax=Cohaesibacter sp. CAU 1516 TaxID=2576038 RepID=UPI0010FDDB22|nr:very short patch repair endonuclease [Cohaesibacter sp. CAU 1516]TLP45706.1 DNA mismatch endonuclease Vsr [Cohaesibacter sp. CAU 1516]